MSRALFLHVSCFSLSCLCKTIDTYEPRESSLQTALWQHIIRHWFQRPRCLYFWCSSFLLQSQFYYITRAINVNESPPLMLLCTKCKCTRRQTNFKRFLVDINNRGLFLVLTRRCGVSLGYSTDLLCGPDNDFLYIKYTPLLLFCIIYKIHSSFVYLSP